METRAKKIVLRRRQVGENFKDLTRIKKLIASLLKNRSLRLCFPCKGKAKTSLDGAAMASPSNTIELFTLEQQQNDLLYNVCGTRIREIVANLKARKTHG